MLQRVLEPEVMDSLEEAISYDEMDHRQVNELFVDDLIKSGQVHGEALDLGTGTARIPLLLCDRTEHVRIIAVDLSSSMLDVARIKLGLTPHVDRIMLDRVDAKALPFKGERFDVVIANSIVHHIREPASTFTEAVRVCKGGGLIFFRDLTRPATSEEVTKLVKTYAGDEPEHARKLFDDSLRAAFTVEEIRRIVSEIGFPVSTVSATGDRHWTWSMTR